MDPRIILRVLMIVLILVAFVGVIVGWRKSTHSPKKKLTIGLGLLVGGFLANLYSVLF